MSGTCTITVTVVPLPPKEAKGIGTGAILGITLLGAGVLGAVLLSRRK